MTHLFFPIKLFDKTMLIFLNRNFCGFLNTGLGGIVYIGITDSGAVFGVPLTPYQKDHVCLNVQDTLSRFTPPVTEDMYLLRFIPVVDEDDKERETSSSFYDDLQRDTPHRLRTSVYCWCDNDARAQFDTVTKQSLNEMSP